MLRNVIEIDEGKCTGCGECVPTCHEGALQIIDGKARLVSDMFCDGLGACLGHCPEGAMTIVEKEAEPYNESVVMEKIIAGGSNVIKAHLQHLWEHNEIEYLAEAVGVLLDNNIDVPDYKTAREHQGCPGSAAKTLVPVEQNVTNEIINSQLTNWPVQLHLISPDSGQFFNQDILLAADCAGFANPNLHNKYLKNKRLLIACPKLDTNKQSYIDKLVVLMNLGKVKSITVMMMEVPCCGGLYQMVQHAAEFAEREVEIIPIIIGLDGELKN